MTGRVWRSRVHDSPLPSGPRVSRDSRCIWRQMPKGDGGQFGALIAFSPDGQYLYLTVGERQRMTPAQDPNQALGKILRLTLDGKPAPGNPDGRQDRRGERALDRSAEDTEAAKTARGHQHVHIPTPNLAPAETWATGFRHAVRSRVRTRRPAVGRWNTARWAATN